MVEGFVFGILMLVAAAVSYVFQSNSRKEAARRKAAEEERRVHLVQRKYSGSPYASDIAAGLVRQGMTYGMVLDAWGQPASVDRKVLKTKTKEVLKYNPGPRRTFGNKVFLEDGIVVGWESR
jgi:hypothetical protein